VWRRVGAMTNDVPAIFVFSLLKLFKTFPKIQTEDYQWEKNREKKGRGRERSWGESWGEGRGVVVRDIHFGRHRDI
jgi:hypothetical protein